MVYLYTLGIFSVDVYKSDNINQGGRSVTHLFHQMQSSSSRPSSSSIVNGATPPPASAPRLAGPPAGSFGYPPLGASSSGVLAQQVFSGYHHNHQSTTSNPPSASSECIARLKATQAAKAPAAAVVAGVSAAYYGAAVRAVQPVALSFSPALPASGADSARDPTSLSSRASLMDSLADVRRRLGELGATPEYCDNYFRGRVGTCECVEDVCVRHKRGLPPPPEGFIDQEKSVKEIAENRATYNFVCGRITANRDKLKRVVNLLRVVSDQLKVDGFFSEEAGAASTSLESAGTAAADAAAASLPCSTSVEGLSEALDVAPPVSTSPSSKIQDQKVCVVFVFVSSPSFVCCLTFFFFSALP